VKEVSSKVIELYKTVAAEEDHPRLFDGLSFTADEYPDRIDWLEFCLFSQRFGELLGGDEALRRIGHDIIKSPVFMREGSVMQLVAGPRLLFWGNMRWGGPMMFNNIVNLFEDLGSDQIRLTLEIPAEMADCPELFLLNHGFFEAMPRMLGLADAVVELEQSPRRGVYTVSMPPSLTLWARIKRAFGVVFNARMVFDEMAAQQQTLKRRYEELQRVHVKADEERKAAVTARNIAEKALAVKSDFLATMSHEIRTPLNGVIGMTEVLMTTDLDDSQREFTETIRSSGTTLLTLLNDILDFSKIDAGRLEFEVIDFSVETVMEEVLDMLAEPAQRKGLELCCIADAEVPICVGGDPNRIRQILTNLVGNAIKFTHSGEVVIHTKLEREEDDTCWIRFEVRDTGIGVPPESRNKLFEPFTQADSATTRKYGGTGLGLAICGGIVSLMGGTIGLESSTGGERSSGSVFYFTLPLKRRSKVNVAQGSDVQMDRLHVLIVDDNATNRLIVQEHLSLAGAMIDSARNGPEALEWLKAGRRPSLVLLDMHMPGMDGMMVARQIQKMSHMQGVPLVMLTSLLSSGYAESAREAGIVRYLTKPVRKAELFRTIASLQEVIDEQRPRLIAGSTAQAPAATAEPAEDNNEPTILVAEDNIINQRVIQMLLKNLGVNTHIVGNGHEVVEAVRDNAGRYELILMDCHMPEMDGFEASAKIRGMGEEISIVAVTADAMPGTRERCLTAGMNDYINKPIKVDELAAILEKWSRKKKRSA
jgi:signal transduction histidine kinase/DNA-binding response OmpR family regulator